MRQVTAGVVSGEGWRDQQPEGREAIVADVHQEGTQLLRSPDLHLRGDARRWDDGIGHVAVQVAEADGVLSGPMHLRSASSACLADEPGPDP
jgi:hypothetical protein